MKYYKLVVLIIFVVLSVGCICSTSNAADTDDENINAVSYSNHYAKEDNDIIESNEMDNIQNNKDKSLKTIKQSDNTDSNTEGMKIEENTMEDNEVYGDYSITAESMVQLNNNTNYPMEIEEDYAAEISSVSVPADTKTYKYSDILKTANNTVNYINSNHHLPGTVNVGGSTVLMNEYLLLSCKAVSSTSDITLNQTYLHYTSTTGTNHPRTALTKNQYTTLARNIVDCYDTYGKNPYNIAINNNTMCFDDAVYFYSQILSFKLKNNNSLPATQKIPALYNYDFSEDQDALIINSSTIFNVTASYKSIGDGKYNLTLTPSQTAAIYYTRNGTTPTTQSTKYTNTLQIYNNTLIKYIAVGSNNTKTPVLEFGIYQDATAYMSSKPTLATNKINYTITLATSRPSTIYYTLNGTRPNTKSTKYTTPITTATNYTTLRYIAITSQNKTSPVYYYNPLNPTPYTTILNTTEVRDNHQNIIIIANKPGTIHYTRNGTNPTTSSKLYTPETTMNLSIKTQLKTILVDNNKKQSITNFYQAPQIITPAVAVVKPQTTLINNTQTIQFISNKQNTTIYYTTDGTNPKTSNTTKTTKTSANLKLNKNNKLLYYTLDSEGYKSNIYNYTTPANNEERPIITIYNTTGIYSNGQQRIMIQSNQPGKIYYTTINKNTEPTTYRYNVEFTTNKTTNIQAYTKNTKYSTITEYNPINKTKTTMNYTYAIAIPLYTNSIKTIESISINNKTTFNPYTLNGRTVGYSDLTGKINKTNTNMNQQSIQACEYNNYILMNINNYVYGDINQISMFYYYNTTNYMQYLTILENNKITKQIAIKINKSILNEVIGIPASTAFASNFNNETINKVEIFGATSGIIATSSEYGWDTVQTYTLTNKIITDTIIFNLINNTKYSGNIQTTAFGTHLAGLSTIYFSDSYSLIIAYNQSILFSRQYDIQLLTGVNLWSTAYMTVPDPTLGTVIYSGNSTNSFSFRYWTTIMLPQCEKTAFQLCNMTTTSSLDNIYDAINSHALKKGLEFVFDNQTNTLEIETETILFSFKYNNESQIIEITTNSTERILFDLETGIIKVYTRDYMEVLLNIDTEYKGAITLDGQGYCFHNERTIDLKINLQNIIGEFVKAGDSIVEAGVSQIGNIIENPIEEIVSTVEDIGGSTMIQMGATMFATFTPVGVIAGVILVGVGSYMCLQASDVDIFHLDRNPAGLIEASITIGTSILGPESTVITNLYKLSKPTIKTATKSVLATLDKEKYQIIEDQREGYVQGLKTDPFIEGGFNYLNSTIAAS